MIRELHDEADLEAVVTLLAVVYPEAVTTVEGFRHRLRSEPERARRRRWVAESDGRVIGWATGGMATTSDRDDVAFLAVAVHPDARRRGLGSELFARAEDHVVALGARKLMTESRDDDASQRFAERRRFRHTHTLEMSSVDPRTVDVTDLAPLRGAAEAAGLRLAPFADLRDRVRAIYESDLETTLDIPMDEPVTNMPFDEWTAAYWENPLLSLDASFAVLDGERVAALTVLRVAGDRGMTDMTGTLRAYRRRGLARLAKLASLDAAARLGVTRVITDNDRTNTPMLALNRRLGFSPHSAVLSWTRE